MRIIFFGTGHFGIASLEKLLASSHEVVAVITQPDRKKGRGWRTQPTPVKDFVSKDNTAIEVLQPENASDPACIKSLKSRNADIFVVIDYGQFLSKELLEVPPKYCLNLHPSLLPKYRGAAPVNWAILNGEKETGNTIIKMNERMDAGDIIMQESFEISPDEDSLALSKRLSISGAELLLEAVDLIESGKDDPVAQDEDKASFARKLQKEMGEIDWSLPADEIVLKIRAFSPWPGAYTYLNGKLLKICDASVCSGEGEEGKIISTAPFTISAGKGALEVKELQLEGKKEMSPDEFLRGSRLNEGEKLGK